MRKIVKVRCPHCNKVMRNDGSEQEPIWNCDNQKCVKYKPPKTNEDE